MDTDTISEKIICINMAIDAYNRNSVENDMYKIPPNPTAGHICRMRNDFQLIHDVRLTHKISDWEQETFEKIIEELENIEKQLYETQVDSPSPIFASRR